MGWVSSGLSAESGDGRFGEKQGRNPSLPDTAAPIQVTIPKDTLLQSSGRHHS